MTADTYVDIDRDRPMRRRRDQRKKGRRLMLVAPFNFLDGAPGRIRTSDPQVRSLVLYPAELRALSRKIMAVESRSVKRFFMRWNATAIELAESEGFEPSMEFNPHTPLAGEPLQPLGQLSASHKPVRPGSITAHPTRGKFFSVGGVVGVTLGRLFAALDALVDLFAVHCYIFRRSDADTYLVSLDAEHGDGHRVADHQGFTDASRQDKHEILLVPRFVRRRLRCP